MTPLDVIQVVRRYGEVGGMERYVWQLSHELARLGHRVSVVCETIHGQPDARIGCAALGPSGRPRPRWLALARFGKRARAWLEAHAAPGAVIHSHERLDCHHVTTFHGPPFAHVRESGWGHLFSPRVWMHLRLERRELLSPSVRAVVPVSSRIGAELARYYPEAASRIAAPIAPGVAAPTERGFRAPPADGGLIGFVGVEWKRKGLDIAAAALHELRKTRPGSRLRVIGADPDAARPLFSAEDVAQGRVELLGWRSDAAAWDGIDLLLHPARAEPYGMVVAEAMARRIPVVISDVCGVADAVGPEAGAVLPLDAPPAAWAAACAAQLERRAAPPRFARGWDVVAREYEALYRGIAA